MHIDPCPIGFLFLSNVSFVIAFEHLSQRPSLGAFGPWDHDRDLQACIPISSAPHLIQIRWIWTRFRAMCVFLLFLPQVFQSLCQAKARRRPVAQSANAPLLLVVGCYDFSCGSPPPTGKNNVECSPSVTRPPRPRD
jgi:hypothetical protein